jgi:hypothetical protein
VRLKKKSGPGHVVISSTSCCQIVWNYECLKKLLKCLLVDEGVVCLVVSVEDGDEKVDGDDAGPVVVFEGDTDSEDVLVPTV